MFGSQQKKAAVWWRTNETENVIQSHTDIEESILKANIETNGVSVRGLYPTFYIKLYWGPWIVTSPMFLIVFACIVPLGALSHYRLAIHASSIPIKSYLQHCSRPCIRLHVLFVCLNYPNWSTKLSTSSFSAWSVHNQTCGICLSKLFFWKNRQKK